MQYFSQLDPKWKNKEFAPNMTFGNYGCFICSLSMLVNLTPPETVSKLGDGLQNGLIVSDKAAQRLGLDYFGVSKDKPDYDCIGETNYFAPKNPQHFFIVKKDGSLLDPLGKNINYPIVSYRLFRAKEEEVNVHEWNAELVRRSRKAMNIEDEAGANADIELLDRKFAEGDKYEAGKLMERYVKAMPKKSCEYEVAQAVGQVIIEKDKNYDQMEALKNADIDALKKQVEKLKNTPCGITEKSSIKDFIEWLKSLFIKE